MNLDIIITAVTKSKSVTVRLSVHEKSAENWIPTTTNSLTIRASTSKCVKMLKGTNTKSLVANKLVRSYNELRAGYCLIWMRIFTITTHFSSTVR